MQGVTDNKLTPNHFNLVIEPITSKTDDADRAAYHTLSAHYASYALLYPNVILLADDNQKSEGEFLSV